nr:hypothetical protein [uncultured Tyzzerella sp.]
MIVETLVDLVILTICCELMILLYLKIKNNAIRNKINKLEEEIQSNKLIKITEEVKRFLDSDR